MEFFISGNNDIGRSSLKMVSPGLLILNHKQFGVKFQLRYENHYDLGFRNGSNGDQS